MFGLQTIQFPSLYEPGCLKKYDKRNHVHGNRVGKGDYLIMVQYYEQVGVLFLLLPTKLL